MGCCTDIIKYLLFLFNVLFWVAGAAILGVGIYLITANNVDAVVSIAGIQFYYSGCYVMIAVGSFMFLVGFCGCCGAIKENKCLLGTYFVLLMVVFIIQFTVGIWALVSQKTIEDEIFKGLNESVPIDYSLDSAKANTIVSIQKTFKCCGLVTGCGDWANGNTTGCGCTEDPTIVNSTCGAIPSTCSAADGATAIYNIDCYDALIKFINDNIVIIGGVALGIALAEIFGMIFAIVMCRNPSKGYETY
uniref:Tetraspanin n=1 Tax=Phallusia mammillata TaxID=59560 RepID=A0A6F9D9E3_9ASCI|nr:CD81 antigen-like [Phallusia mammillata]